MKTSHDELDIEEDTFGPTVTCESEAVPEPSMSWLLDDKVITESGVLSFDKPLQRYFFSTD